MLVMSLFIHVSIFWTSFFNSNFLHSLELQKILYDPVAHYVVLDDADSKYLHTKHFIDFLPEWVVPFKTKTAIDLDCPIAGPMGSSTYSNSLYYDSEKDLHRGF